MELGKIADTDKLPRESMLAKDFAQRGNCPDVDDIWLAGVKKTP